MFEVLSIIKKNADPNHYSQGVVSERAGPVLLGNLLDRNSDSQTSPQTSNNQFMFFKALYPFVTLYLSS